MSIPAIIVIVLFSIEFGTSAALHGKERKDNTYNAFDTLVALGILTVLLYLGGFFS